MDGAKSDGSKPVVQTAEPAGSGAAGGTAEPATTPGAAIDDEVDDEQVERFYALLANIRAMRGVYAPGGGGATAAGDCSGARRKRLRSAEPSWRPAFRLEDFKDDAACMSRCVRKKEASQPADADVKKGDDGPVVASPSLSPPPPPPPRRPGARRLDSDSKSV
ncbi:hypothetical protein PR202_ga04445 [Eleusine coracana subsp. coracana]|uniref:Uncharacterized protein n=1 Tax=Eleusine coracana subsp. coracana TaxID=191504 RepID=A0AAV5BR67_ELECO|nr:hypothetical protein PR202_ga04445 [Eleusine coracana subsp. coracana]